MGLRILKRRSFKVGFGVSIFKVSAFAIALATSMSVNADYCMNMQLLANDSRLHRNDFTINRGGLFYISTFGQTFVTFIKSLAEGTQWLDSGAGQAQAMKELSEGVIYEGALIKIQSSRLRALAVEKPRDFEFGALDSQQNTHLDFKYLEGKYIEDTTYSEIGSCDLITDFFGPFTYTARIDLVVQKYLELLKIGGSAFIHFSPTSTTINGSKNGVLDFLKSVKNIKVTVIDERATTVRIEKTGWTTAADVPVIHLDEFWSQPNSVPIRRYHR